MSTTIKDIARVAGVTANTVSRALRNKEGVNQETSARIHELAKMMGYSPNLMAQSLVLKKTNTIGLAATELNNPYQTEFIAELSRNLRKRGYRLISSELFYNDSNNNTIRELIGNRVDALIVGDIVPSTIGAWQALEPVIKSGLPVVIFGNTATSLVDNLCRDYTKCAELLMKHLIEEKAFKKISFFSPYLIERVAFYEDFMRKAGLAQYINIIKSREPQDRDFLLSSREDILKYLDNGGSLPEVIITNNDIIALGVMSGLAMRGIKVPDDVAVAGFDNIEFADFSNPRLTSVGFSYKDSVNKIMEMLFERIDKKRTVPRTITAVPQLFVRESTLKK